MAYLFKTFGVIGLLLITYSIFINKEVKRDLISGLGGVFLLAYSIYLKDLIFTILQLIFIISSLYAAKKLSAAGHHLPISISAEENVNLAKNQTNT